jgi:DNA-binding HxlR family transcriptional regulator
MTHGSYMQFCPVAMSAEVLCKRWTMLVLREMILGSTRFNDLRRGLPRMSPALLSLRLRELEAAGIVDRAPVPGEPGVIAYHLTEAGQDLRPVVEAFGLWGQRWVPSELSLQRLDVSLLMWDMRRNLVPAPLPDRRVVLQFHYSDVPRGLARWWLLIGMHGDVDLCLIDPGYDVDLYAASDVRTMTAIWMGVDTVAAARADERLLLNGDRQLIADMQSWLGLSPFAKERKRAI